MDQSVGTLSCVGDWGGGDMAKGFRGSESLILQAFCAPLTVSLQSIHDKKKLRGQYTSWTSGCNI